jgi:hypothetical protein
MLRTLSFEAPSGSRIAGPLRGAVLLLVGPEAAKAVAQRWVSSGLRRIVY